MMQRAERTVTITEDDPTRPMRFCMTAKLDAYASPRAWSYAGEQMARTLDAQLLKGWQIVGVPVVREEPDFMAMTITVVVVVQLRPRPMDPFGLLAST